MNIKLDTLSKTFGLLSEIIVISITRSDHFKLHIIKYLVDFRIYFALTVLDGRKINLNISFLRWK